MQIPHVRRLILAVLGLAWLISATTLTASDETTLTNEQIKQFLRTAKVVKSKGTSTGITMPYRLTLTDGTLTHDAEFQSVDERKPMKEFIVGSEINFVDSYKYNIAAYTLAEMLGIEDMLPVTVERKWQGKVGSLSWWLPVMMDELQRTKKKLQSPDAEAWNQQMYRIRVFDQLVYDTDPNLTNVLIGHDWKLWRIDFTRAFRLYDRLQSPASLQRCDRRLLEKLKALDGRELAQRTKGYLTEHEVKSLMARRDLIVKHFEKLVAEKGANEVLY